jgi:hypothetical protein
MGVAVKAMWSPCCWRSTLRWRRRTPERTMAAVTPRGLALTRSSVESASTAARAARVLGRTAPGSKPASRTAVSYSEDVAGDGDGEDADDGFAGAHGLEGDHGVVRVEGEEFFEAETDEGEGFGEAVGEGFEVEQEDADGGVGDDEGDAGAGVAGGAGVGALTDLFQSAADGGGDGDAVDDVAGFEAGDDGTVEEGDLGDRGEGCGGVSGTGGDDALRHDFAGHTWAGSGGLGEKVHEALSRVPCGAKCGALRLDVYS